MKPRVMFYCQHVLGMGHLIRSVEIMRSLAECADGLFLNGGEALEGIQLPSSVRVVNLPPIVSDAEFNALTHSGSEHNMQEIQQFRTQRIMQELHSFSPDIFMIELFPFGRIRFAFELIPVLARIRLDQLPIRVVCSLRDILVSKSDQTRHEEWVCSLINRYFHSILLHADPAIQTLEESFFRADDLDCPIHYTGFVVQPLPDCAAKSNYSVPGDSSDSPLIVVSIGGGRVGYELLIATIEAVLLLRESLPCRLMVFTGPYIPEQQWQAIQKMTQGISCFHVKRYATDFLCYLRNADLSISMAGYNTCMNLVMTGIKAYVLPFTGRGNDEQTIRARKLERLGIVRMLSPADLTPNSLAKRIQESLQDAPGNSKNPSLNTSGAETTARLIQKMPQHPAACDRPLTKKLNSPEVSRDGWVDRLAQALDQLQINGNSVRIFLRDDDIDQDEESLRTLADVTLTHGVPLNLEVIPGGLSSKTIRFLKNLKRINPSLIEFNQHGWQHVNHEKQGKKCEFGASRSFEQQFHDIARGKAILEESLEHRFYPVFTPPWNRCTPDTFRVLDELGFKVLSKDRGAELTRGYGFREISTTLDIFNWKNGAILRSPDEIVQTLVDQFKQLECIGLLLHHKVMDAQAFKFLDLLLGRLRDCPAIQFHNFESLLEVGQ